MKADTTRILLRLVNKKILQRDDSRFFTGGVSNATLLGIKIHNNSHSFIIIEKNKL
jgi:hypothetical protein